MRYFETSFPPDVACGDDVGPDDDYDAWHEAGHCAAELLLGSVPKSACIGSYCGDSRENHDGATDHTLDVMMPLLSSIQLRLGGVAAEEVRAEQRGEVRHTNPKERGLAEDLYLHMLYGPPPSGGYHSLAKREATHFVESEIARLKGIFRQSRGLDRVAGLLFKVKGRKVDSTEIKDAWLDNMRSI
jgi:hypothetical protein